MTKNSLLYGGGEPSVSGPQVFLGYSEQDLLLMVIVILTLLVNVTVFGVN